MGKSEEFQLKWRDVVKQISKVESKVEANKKEYAEAQKVVTDLRDKIITVQTNMDGINDRYMAQPDLSRNIVIRGIPESQNEDVKNRVQGLLKDGVKLKSITVNNAKRKKSFKQDTPGVVIATLQSVENRKCVMANTSKLRGTKNVMNMMVYEDKTFQQESMNQICQPSLIL